MWGGLSAFSLGTFFSRKSDPSQWGASAGCPATEGQRPCTSVFLTALLLSEITFLSHVVTRIHKHNQSKRDEHSKLRLLSTTLRKGSRAVKLNAPCRNGLAAHRTPKRTATYYVLACKPRPSPAGTPSPVSRLAQSAKKCPPPAPCWGFSSVRALFG